MRFKLPSLKAVRFPMAAVLEVMTLGGAILFGMTGCNSLGRSPEGERQARLERSPQWQSGKFVNRYERVDGSRFSLLKDLLFGNAAPTRPTDTLPVQTRRRSDFDSAPGLRTTWLGHSTLIVEIEGQRLLIDPVWGERASPVSFAGPERWYPSPLPFDELPEIDAVLISHDHYDHLDYPTVLKLIPRGARWIVPLGVGAHLEAWGVPAAQIVELDWWGSTELSGLTITATPARHFSGRGLRQDQTLWCGFALTGVQRRVYYSGDTALFDDLATIGERLGPFDLTMIEVGAYDRRWTDVHLGPEQAVRAHQLVKGNILLPVHWGLFSLGFHGWTEPMERVLAAAKEHDISVAVLRPGESLSPPELPMQDRWWPEVPWLSGKVDPIHSSGVEHLMH
ncbi:MBL fold metallo-hydrolase [Oligoflexus tunisiensis]|uniref:MBL fold metallo-hydrolase n=1 Tax=Oligoflexus tunisiensis TaxID=708132 RepID=UPI000A9C1CAA|nr:MBL fold metallo-hydrolase [Oligoflexus tunisiensis]